MYLYRRHESFSVFMYSRSIYCLSFWLFYQFFTFSTQLFIENISIVIFQYKKRKLEENIVFIHIWVIHEYIASFRISNESIFFTRWSAHTSVKYGLNLQEPKSARSLSKYGNVWFACNMYSYIHISYIYISTVMLLLWILHKQRS